MDKRKIILKSVLQNLKSVVQKKQSYLLKCSTVLNQVKPGI